MEIPLKQLKILLKTLEEGRVTEFEYQDEKYRVKLGFGGGRAVDRQPELRAKSPEERSVAAASAEQALGDDPNVTFITSPFVGTFYRATSPEGPPMVEPGTSVTAGQPLCIVEAMKLMNEIEAEFACVILEVFVENGHSVEFGQKMFKVRKA